MLAAVGSANMLSGVDATVATLAPFVNVNCTDDATPGLAPVTVPPAITTTTVVALAYVHDVASVPLLADAPTFALHTKPDMKFAPVTVIVLPTYADVGEIESTVGSPTTLKLLLLPKLSVSLGWYASNDILISQAAAAVPSRMTTVAVVLLTQVHADSDAVASNAVGATYALQAVLVLGKPVPVIVTVLVAYAEAGETPAMATLQLAVCSESASTAKYKSR